MKLLVDGDVFCWQKQGGVSRVFMEILPRLAALDAELEIDVVVAGPVTSSALAQMPVRVRRVPQIPDALRPWRLWSPLRRVLNPYLLRRFWVGCKGDVFVSTYFTSPPVTCPSVCFVHDMVNELYPELFGAEFLEEMVPRKRDAVGKASRISCGSENTQRDVVRLLGVDPSICRVVHYAGSVTGEQIISQGLPGDADKPFLLFVGDYLSPYKNFAFMMECLAEIWAGDNTVPGLKVVSAVTPPPDVQDRYAPYIARGQLVFVNECPDERLLFFYEHCAGFLYPSVYEGFGIPIVEALSSGTPVVCSDIPVFREVAGNAVYYFERESRSAFCEAMQRALAHGRSTACVESRKARAAVFSWDRAASRFLEVLREVV